MFLVLHSDMPAKVREDGQHCAHNIGYSQGIGPYRLSFLTSCLNVDCAKYAVLMQQCWMKGAGNVTFFYVFKLM